MILFRSCFFVLGALAALLSLVATVAYAVGRVIYRDDRKDYWESDLKGVRQ